MTKKAWQNCMQRLINCFNTNLSAIVPCRLHQMHVNPGNHLGILNWHPHHFFFNSTVDYSCSTALILRYLTSSIFSITQLLISLFPLTPSTHCPTHRSVTTKFTDQYFNTVRNFSYESEFGAIVIVSYFSALGNTKPVETEQAIPNMTRCPCAWTAER